MGCPFYIVFPALQLAADRYRSCFDIESDRYHSGLHIAGVKPLKLYGCQCLPLCCGMLQPLCIAQQLFALLCARVCGWELVQIYMGCKFTWGHHVVALPMSSTCIERMLGGGLACIVCTGACYALLATLHCTYPMSLLMSCGLNVQTFSSLSLFQFVHFCTLPCCLRLCLTLPNVTSGEQCWMFGHAQMGCDRLLRVWYGLCPAQAKPHWQGVVPLYWPATYSHSCQLH